MTIFMKNKNLLLERNFSLPLSPNGTSSLVQAPPWHFGGELIEVIYRADPNTIAQFLPKPFVLVDSSPFVSIAMTDVISVKEGKDIAINPERTQYKECLVKLYASIRGKNVWYVPTTWVTTDFSLMRGFLLGFGKKLGKISLTRFHELNPVLPTKRKGTIMTGICEAFHTMNVSLNLTLEKKTSEIGFTNIPICVTRRFPDVGNPSKILYSDVTELIVGNYKRKNIWLAKGSVNLQKNNLEPLTNLQPLEIITARTYSEGFTVLGVKSLYKY